MIAAVMQPYFFPYIGYFQLMYAVNVFVFYDDVQYIDRGWVNRNRIRIHDKHAWLTLPVQKAARAAAINERHYLVEKPELRRVERTLAMSYGRAACFHEIMPFLMELLHFPDNNVASFNANLLTRLARKLGIECRFKVSSQLGLPDGLKGQERVIALCRALGADRYLNPIGGAHLYRAEDFAASGIELSFLQTLIPASGLSEDATHLSVIDGLMREGFSAVSAQLPNYRLARAP